MMRLSLFIFALMSFNSFAQCPSEVDSLSSDSIYTSVDSLPHYNGETSELISFVTKNFVYPKEQERFQGSIRISFIVEKDGTLTGFSNAKADKELSLADKEAIRVLKLMPPWIPGKCNGIPVRVKLIFPITF